MTETDLDSDIAGKTRAKFRTKKPMAFEDAMGLANMKKVKRRRATQKRRGAVDEDEHVMHKEMEQMPLGPDSLQLMQRLHEDQRYDRQLRPMPDIVGVKSLSNYEAQLDVRRIQHQLAAFEACAGIKLPGGRPKVGDKDHRRLFLVDEINSKADTVPVPGAARPSRVIAPEEIIETLPAARRAVRITQRELRALRIEREELERAFVRHRCTLLWQIGEMKRMQNQQSRVTRALSRKVVNTAKSLESSRRRTSALQDIMTELEARGSRILRLTREKSRLEAMLEAHNVELPEIDEVCAGDRVKWTPFGTGRVLQLRIETRQVVVNLDVGGIGYIQEENVEVLPSDMTFYAATEEELRKRFFEKIGALVQWPRGKLRVLTRGFNFTQNDNEEEDSDNNSDEYSSSDEELGVTPGDNYMEDVSQRRGKKRRLIMTPTPGVSTKESKSRRVIEFPASTIPIVPYETGLLISPLSELPERVAAVGPGALQWFPSYLPKNMDEWEQERLSSLQMKGEIERLRFQLQKAEAQKLDAQQLASDQLESINQLVSQLDKLRDNVGVSSGPVNLADTCPTCSSHTASKVHKNPHNGRGSIIQRKDSGAKHNDSDDELSETNSSSSKAEDSNDARKTSKRKHSNTENAEEETSNETNAAPTANTKTKAKPVKRSLRPRRKAVTASPQWK